MSVWFKKALVTLLRWPRKLEMYTKPDLFVEPHYAKKIPYINTVTLIYLYYFAHSFNLPIYPSNWSLLWRLRLALIWGKNYQHEKLAPLRFLKIGREKPIGISLSDELLFYYQCKDQWNNYEYRYICSHSKLKGTPCLIWRIIKSKDYVVSSASLKIWWAEGRRLL